MYYVFMKRYYMFLIVCLLFLPLNNAENEKIRVVTTTSITGSIVEDLAGDKVEVYTIANPSLCPAHYDLKPSDIEIATKADILIYQGFEPWVEQIEEELKEDVVIEKVSGPWNTPENLKKYYQQIASILEEKIDLGDRLQSCLEYINKTDSELKKIAEENGFGDIKVCCQEFQKAFVSYLGFNVTISYPSPETLTSQDIAEIEEKIREENIKLVISNLQSGTSLGEALEGMGLVHVVLTNFPGTGTELHNMSAVMLYNAKKLASAVENLGIRSELSLIKSKLQVYEYATFGLIAVAIVEAIIIWRKNVK